jgi:hypothetical protein
MLGKTDGLVAYFAPPASTTGGTAWTVVTDFTGAEDISSSSVVQHTATATLLTASPVYPRLIPAPTTANENINIVGEVAAYDLCIADSLYSSITTVLIDPFLPMHIRSAIPPVVLAELDYAVVNY